MKLSVIGIDVGKNVLHVHGADAQGKSVLRKTFGRGALVEWLAQQAPCLIGMEACGGAHHLARVLIDCGHTVRLIHPSFVKAYVKSNKNDFRDAEAIAEAVTRPTMRFVAIKTVAQQELQALHRLRSGAVTQRTVIINQLRGLLLEFGLTVLRGPTALRRRLPEILETADGGLQALGRELLAELQREWVHLDERIAALEQRLKQQTQTLEPCRRLRSIPGIGVLGASAFVAAFGGGCQFASGRDCAAALGLVPRQHSTGGRSQLGSISKRGDAYLRALFIHGARAVLRYADRHDDPRSRWVWALKERRGVPVAAVALANKMARTAWAVLTRGTTYQVPVAA